MANAGEALRRVVNEYADNREKMLRAKVLVNQQKKAQELQTEFYNRMNEDLVKLPAGEFNAESYLQEYNARADELMSQYEDPESKLQFEQMFNNGRSQLSLKANKFELKSFKALEDQSVQGWNNQIVQNAYQGYAAGEDPYNYIEDVYFTANALKEGISDEGKQKVDQATGEHLVLLNNLRNQQFSEALIQNHISLDEYTTAVDESIRLINEIPLEAGQRILVNEQLQEQKSKAITLTTNAAIKSLKDDFEGNKLLYERTGTLPKNYKKNLIKMSQYDPSLNYHIRAFDIIDKSRPFYNAKAIGDTSTMGTEVSKAYQEREQAKETGGQKYLEADARFNKLYSEFNKAKIEQKTNFAQFYSNNPQVRILKNEGQASGNMTRYVNYMQALARQQGLDPNHISLLDNQDIETIKGVIGGIRAKDTKTVRSTLTQLQNIWGANFQNVMGQVYRNNQDDLKLHATKYINTPNFEKLWEAASLSDDEVKGLASYSETKKSKFQSAFNSAAKNYYESRQAQGDTAIGNTQLLNSQLAYRTHLFTNQDATRIASDLFNREYEYITNNRVNVRLPKALASQQMDLRGIVKSAAIQSITGIAPSIDSIRENLGTTSLALKLKSPDLPNAVFREIKNKYTGNYDFALPEKAADFEVPKDEGKFSITGKEFPRGKSIAEQTQKLMDDTVRQQMQIVTGNNGIRIMLQGRVGDETLLPTPLTINGEIVEFTWDELEEMKL